MERKMSEFWNDSNDPNGEGEFRDIPDEVVEGASAPPVNIPNPPRTAPAVQVIGQEAYEEASEYEEEYEDEEGEYEAESAIPEEETEEDYSNILDDARLRLEQGRLYEMVMKHNLFENLDADPKAALIVQKQIVKFAKEQMEIMLGMRQPKSQTNYDVVSSPFNDLEVKLLKEFASKMSGGKSAEAGANKIAQKLNSIGSPSRPQREMAPVQPRQSAPAPRAPQQALPQAPSAPLKRKKKVSMGIDRLLREGMSPKDVGYKPLKKHPGQMTTDELLKRNEEAKLRQASQKTARPANAMPLPSYEQEEAHHANRVTGANGTVALIMKAIELQNKKH